MVLAETNHDVDALQEKEKEIGQLKQSTKTEAGEKVCLW